MSQARIFAIVFSLLGIVFSIWVARPSQFSSLEGWVFAGLWSPLAWWIPCALSAGRWSLYVAMGSLFAIAGCELFVFTLHGDGFLLAIKPFYQIPAGAIGALLGFLIERSSAERD
jgi:hypothetical protein